ncbi:MAG: rhodanese-like domain-containing protein [Rhodospirillaceae bacterium]|jgi:rhodanese-related sulfurtransferase|nr:rhodanese-like domain-containing protein [Rhodospirillaceae bacterium]MBT5945595.1 rhodanese-like domain-containing protein [Rhodospirillaceae bacterium]MBT6403821.1 rhodanese-like domain-containing protein [Rhodospirillaceae bacterium]MBT6536176.1 rhodanese-like domain-containing protein [Rhodospirillaceae bacterium]MBT7362559.1 rhodanese-like domain-containing protein [Rhodospirillaceae bacterium]
MSENPTGPQVIMLTANDVRERIAGGTAYVVDVREPHENAQMRIAGAQLVPLSNFNSSQITPADGQDLILHCRSGQRCGIAADQLVAEGYSGTIYRMAGGILDWMSADFPVETG